MSLFECWFLDRDGQRWETPVLIEKSTVDQAVQRAMEMIAGNISWIGFEVTREGSLMHHFMRRASSPQHPRAGMTLR